VSVFLDASVIVAILTREADADSLSDRLDELDTPMTSSLAIFESALGVAKKRKSMALEAAKDVRDFLEMAQATIVSITGEDAELALSAFDRFGRGRHRAALNMGDCFAYACAKSRNVPLLFKGDDFVHTDIASA